MKGLPHTNQGAPAVVKRTSREIRTANRYGVLREVIASSGASRRQLAAQTGLSFATAANVVAELMESGVLVETGYEDSGGGRPRGLLGVNPRGGALIGVDVAETYIHVELFDLSLGRLASAEEEVRPGENRPEQVVEHIASTVRTLLARAAPPAVPVLGAGVSVPGQIDRQDGVSLFAPNWNWRDVPLRTLLAARLAADGLDFPLYLDNPLRATAMAQLWFGAARGREDVLVVNLGTGVGAGLVLGGMLHRGHSNSAGEWGHTTLVLDGRLCGCGDHGCVEAYVGAPGIMQTLRELAPGSPLLHPDDQSATVRAIGSALRDGDPTAAKVVGETARYLGAAVADLVNLLNPEVVVLSSWVASALGEPLLARTREATAIHALRRPLDSTEIVLCPIAGDPVSLGAATLALEGFLDWIRPPSAPRRPAATPP